MRIALTILTLLALAPCAYARETWRPPTGGAVTRSFAVTDNPFARGNHRGADFEAAPGTPVRAACSGSVVVAARIGSSGGVLTLACGPWRVSHLPLATIGPRVGVRIRAGDPIGTAGTSPAHDGIHIGVRRANERFGYVDPLRFIRGDHHTPIPAFGPRATPRRTKPAATPNAVATPRPVSAAPRPVSAAPRPVSAAPRDRPLAPWPAWAALAAALLLAATTGRIARHARRTNTRATDRARTRPRPNTPAIAAPARDDLRP